MIEHNTGISWTHRPGTRGRTWNPTRGCSRVSEGCRHCYAETMAACIVRMGKGKPTPYDGLVRSFWHKGPTDDDGVEYDKREDRWTGKVVLDAAKLAEPLRWREPSTVFVNSMSDLFHEELTNEQIAAVFGVMAACPRHTFIVLTKRSARMRAWFQWLRGPSEDTFTMQQRGIASAPNTFRALLDAAYEVLGRPSKPALDSAWHSELAESDPWPLHNVWLGVSVENQDAADERIPDLLQTPAAVRLLSIEPMLGAVDLNRVQTPDAPQGLHFSALHEQHDACFHNSPAQIDWVIAGCESGAGARPCDVRWLRSLRDQCAEAGVPFFLKQARATTDSEAPGIGAVTAGHVVPEYSDPPICAGEGAKRKPGGVIELPYLDGVQHAEFPEVRP